MSLGGERLGEQEQAKSQDQKRGVNTTVYREPPKERGFGRENREKKGRERIRGGDVIKSRKTA